MGDGPEMSKIKNKAKNAKNIDILGFQTVDVLTDYMQRAKAFVFAAEEDFGIMPVEAQACGTPVIAYGKGGCLETVRGLEHLNPTGVFFTEQTQTAICQAIDEFESHLNQFSVDNCVFNASRFSVEIFREKMKAFVNRI